MIEKVYTGRFKSGGEFDTIKTIFMYENGLLAKENIYRYSSKIKPDFQGCSPIYPKDYLPKKWRSIGEIYYFYDKKQHLIEKYAPDVGYPSNRRNKYEYDENGRLIKELLFKADNLIWTKTYQYEPNKEIMKRVWEHEGEVEEWTNPLYWKFEKQFDDKGNLIREECHFDKLNKKNVFYHLKIYQYDEMNRIIKYESFGEDMNREIIHRFIYK